MEYIKFKNKKLPESSKKADKILELVVKIDKIHKENGGKMTIDEWKLRIEVRVNLKLWSVETTLKKIIKFFKVVACKA